MADIKIKKDHCPLMEAADIVAYSAWGKSIFGVKKGNAGYFGKSVIFEFERTGGCKAFIQGSDQGKEAVRDSLPSFRRRRGGQGTDRCGTPVCQSVCKKAYTY